jgi:hypothetical protein
MQKDDSGEFHYMFCMGVNLVWHNAGKKTGCRCGKRALREVGWRRRLKILLNEEFHNLYSAKSKLEEWNGRKM